MHRFGSGFLPRPRSPLTGPLREPPPVQSLLVAYDLIATDESSENYTRLIARIKEYPNSGEHPALVLGREDRRDPGGSAR